MSFVESEERSELRKVVGELGKKYGYEWFNQQARTGGHTTELWLEAGKLGFLGVNLPEQYGGGGGGMADLSIVLEELGAAGCPLLMMVVSPSICGTVISRFGTDEQKQHWLPGLADGTTIMAFAITEPDAGSNSHQITTTARRTENGWSLTGRKVFISGLDVAKAILVVGRTEDARTGKLKPALFIVPIDAPGVEFRQIEMDLISPDKQYALFLDDVQLPREALVGSEDAALMQLFAGLNPERIMASAFAVGIARHALDKATAYVKQRQVWRAPIGAHQGLAHPLAQIKIELELARLMLQKAAALYDAGEDLAAGEAANMAKYAAGEVAVRATDQAVQSLGGNGMTVEYGVASLVAAARATRIAPVSREMILNFVAQHSLGLPKSY
ncbi:acyl-CoA dehydrogenase family protein [Kribbella soli]|uniref:Acyl-CoA dehydrogenase family protein n=1 Tax=Kribbella soli TaxID=1124743 RepID=A0A4R0HPC2_9ACTN|nr:acyl-CoA dehydrogenase family protein [Kribbella soli]TCC11874.1 acyl-CoA dehydrogenase family protein [Kribbella soli]